MMTNLKFYRNEITTLDEQFSRTALLLRKEEMDKLKNSHVAIFGIGGVGSYVTEVLARTGVGTFSLIDKDIIEISNINRQLIATFDTIGKDKVEVAKTRILSINPNATVFTFKEFYLSGTEVDISNFDYVVDAIDTVTAKLNLIEVCNNSSIPIISSMGMGNKLDPNKVTITDISKTSTCRLCRVMRQELRKRNIKNLKVAYSTEKAVKQNKNTEKNENVIGSVAFVPACAGIMIASEVVKDLLIK